MRLRGRGALAAVVCAAAAVGILVGALGAQAVKGPPAPKLINLAKSESVRGAPGRELALTRVVVPPGAALPPHRHLGTQIARVTRGTLTYTVISGSVVVRSGPADARSRVVRRIRAGQRGKIRPGEWIVEQPHVRHFGANVGKQRVVIYLATLFPKGAPPSVPVRLPPEH